MDRTSNRHRVFRSKINGVGRLLSHSVVRLVKFEFSNLSCKFVGDSRSVLRIGSDLVEVLVYNNNV